MAYIYHIITPKGTYIGQASGQYINPDWPSQKLMGNLNKCRLWWHFTNAYVKGNKSDSLEDADTRAEKEVANILRCYSPSQIDIRIYEDKSDYGIPKEVFKLFTKSWLPNGVRVSKIQLDEVISLIEKMNNKTFPSQRSQSDFINKKFKNRELSWVEKMDIAEILHIYYFTKKGIKLLNTQMGGQVTGWFPIKETALGVDTTEKVLYREMKPSQAQHVLDNYMQAGHQLTKKITTILNTNAQNIFTNKDFWGPTIDYILEDPMSTVFQMIVDKKERSLIVRELSKLVEKQVEPLKQNFINVVNNEILKLFQEEGTPLAINIKDVFNDKEFGFVNWDEILDWLTGYIYNTVQKAIKDTLKTTIDGIYKNYHLKNSQMTSKELKQSLKQVSKQLQTNFNWANTSKITKWKNKDYFEKGAFKVGTMIRLDKFNKLLNLSSTKAHWQKIFKIDSVKTVDKNYLKAYSMILFYHFYKQAKKTVNEIPVGLVGFIDGSKPVIRFAKFNYGKNYEKFLNRKILAEYRKGGMKKSADLRTNWHIAFTEMVHLAELKDGRQMSFYQDVENWSNREHNANSVRVIGNYVCENAPVKDGGITYIAYDFPSKIWGTIQKYGQIKDFHNLTHY